jgi:large subunit ribosomal protein L24
MEKLRLGDEVRVLRGRDRGKSGKIIAILPSEGRVVVEKLNRVKQSLKKSRAHPAGGIVEKESPLSRSNVLIVCPSCKKVTRVGIKLAGKEKVRVCKNCGKGIVFK